MEEDHEMRLWLVNSPYDTEKVGVGRDQDEVREVVGVERCTQGTRQEEGLRWQLVWR